jgi:hypothetical protein
MQVYRKTNCPSYKEKFLFGLEASEFAKRSLTFYVYASDMYANTLIGEAELKLCDVTPRQPVTTWLTLTDTGQVSNFLGVRGCGVKRALTLNFQNIENNNFPILVVNKNELKGKTGLFFKYYICDFACLIHTGVLLKGEGCPAQTSSVRATPLIG